MSEQTNDVTEKTEELAGFSVNCERFVKQKADAGEAGFGDFYIRIRASQKSGGSKAVILSGLPVPPDANDILSTLLDALSGIVGEPYFRVYVELMPTRGRAPSVTASIDWGPGVKQEAGEVTQVSPPTTKFQMKQVDGAISALSGAVVQTNVQLNQTNHVLRLENRGIQQRLFEVMMENKELRGEIAILESGSTAQIVENVLAGVKDPAMAAIAMMEERYKADRQAAVSKEDKESQQYAAGHVAGREEIQADTNKLLDELITYLGDPTDEVKMMLAMEFMRVYGASAAAKLATIESIATGN